MSLVSNELGRSALGVEDDDFGAGYDSSARVVLVPRKRAIVRLGACQTSAKIHHDGNRKQFLERHAPLVGTGFNRATIRSNRLHRDCEQVFNESDFFLEERLAVTNAS
jgi:hypothetical protein